MKNLTTQDLFYDLDDIINLFRNVKSGDKYYKHYKIARSIPVWTGEYATKLSYFKRYDGNKY